jgi:hypothetical protein
VPWTPQAASNARQERLVCEAAVFPPGVGPTKDSLVGVGRSLIVVIEYGHKKAGIYVSCEALTSTREAHAFAVFERWTSQTAPTDERLTFQRTS